ncbi:MAG TPA: PQQ-binding-like beta-propeller repeat protein [Streptosporangiaceae bacterium]|nr:PQQ-binding-like beta-propeller repeat protein [Streptosporangiaceae bacterium]
MNLAPRVVAAISLTVCLAVAACSGGTAPGPARTGRPPATTPAALSSGPTDSSQDWPAYHRDAARTGDAPGLPPAGALSIAWRRTLDGAVYGQPLAIHGLVVAGTEGGSVYGLSAADGHVRWRVHVGTPVPLSSLPCGDIDPLGITSTPVYDPATGLVYAVAETTGFHHVLVGIDVSNGTVRFQRNIPTPDARPRYDQQRSALAVDGGRVYLTFGGLAGDCGPYRGSVVGIPVSGQGPLVSYQVPTRDRGGIWASGGPVAGPDGTLYVPVGNGAATAPPYDGSDSVTALSPGLHRLGIFAPVTWAADNASDSDLGSTSVALLPGGRLLTVGKRGTGYLLDVHHLTGVGYEVSQAPVCGAYGGMSAAGSVAYVPCGSGGMAAVGVTGNAFRVLWRGPAAAAGSPVLGGGAVWVDDYGSGVLYELDPATGQVRHQLSLGGALPHFTSPSLYGSLVLLGTMSGVVAVHGA